MRKPIALLMAFALIPVFAITTWAWERELGEAIASRDSNRKFAAVKALDPSDKKARKTLLKLVEKEDWYTRRAAIQVLSGASGEALEELQKKVKKGSSLLREGLVLAFGRSGDHDLVPDLIERISDKDARVRRAAVISLGEMHDSRSIPAIIEQWKEEKDDRLKHYLYTAIKAITGEKMDPVIVDWENWWKGEQDGFVPPSQRKKEEGDKPGEGKPPEEKKGGTVLRDVELTFTESGRGGPLFCLPMYGYNNDYMVSTMKALEGTCRVFYIDLPALDKFKNLTAVGGTGMPYYPIDKLVDAFDELRKQRKQKRIAIMGHGITAWVAMRYATKYPKNVSHLILVSTFTGGKAWGNGRNRVEADGKERGDHEQEHYAQSLMVDMQSGQPQYQVKDAAEGEALQRMEWSTFFADRREGMAEMLYDNIHRPMGNCLVPDFEVGKEKGNKVPTLIIYGNQALWTHKNDMRQLNKYYPNSMVVGCPSSSMMPMLEDYAIFTKTLKGFFRKYRFSKKVR